MVKGREWGHGEGESGGMVKGSEWGHGEGERVGAW